MKHISKNLEETREIAEKFVENLLKTRGNVEDKACIIALQGDLGSGKTSFTKAAALALGISDTVTSPTFVLEKVYKIQDKTANAVGFTHLIHIDAYRLSGGAEISALGWDELMEKRENIVFLEWPEMVAGALPADVKTVHFRFLDETTREITL